jgi:hypothetical protein
MLNILIQETDQFFHRGLQCFFVDFFTRNFKQPIHFDVELSRDNVSAADIIVLPFCMGDAHLLSRIAGAPKRYRDWGRG